MANFTDLLRFLMDGDEVNAGTINRPLRALDQNIRYLKDLFESVMRGDTLVAHDMLVKSDVLVGQPVYYNVTRQQFEKAIGAAEQDEDTGAYITSDSTQVWGVVQVKHSPTSADVLLHGMGELNLSSAITGDVEPGIYYLSNQLAGKLVKQRPPVGVTVLQAGPEVSDGVNLVFVNTHFHDLLEAHRHFKFSLSTDPSGTLNSPTVDQTYTISAADTDVEGWLPANNAIFGGLAPVGADFGYNISASKLKGLWPPMPLEGTYLELYPGGNELGMAVPIGEGELVQIDANGIWWMNACFGYTPWSMDYNVESISDCSPNGERKLILWFTRPVFANTGTWVSSLEARSGSGLTVSCVDNGDPAKVGNLLIDLDLALTVGPTNTAGHIAFKGIDTDTKKFQLGPVVESLKAGSSNVHLSGDATATNGKYPGNVLVTVDQDLSAGEVGIDLARLNGVDEEYFNGVTGLGFLADRDGSVRWRLNVPTGITIPAGTKVKFVFWILNRSNTNVPAEIFSASYRTIPFPGTSALHLPLNVQEVTIGNLPLEDIDVLATANRYAVIETEELDVAAGDQILLELGRLGSSDGFSGDIYIIRQYGLYVPV
jgi:hypothetical protein